MNLLPFSLSHTSGRHPFFSCAASSVTPVGEAFRERFGNPYAVSHRADVQKAWHSSAATA